MTFFSSSPFVIDCALCASFKRFQTKTMKNEHATRPMNRMAQNKLHTKLFPSTLPPLHFAIPKWFWVHIYFHRCLEMHCFCVFYSRGRFDFVFFATFAVGTNRYTQGTHHSAFIQIHARSRLLTVHYRHFIVEMFVSIRFFALSSFHTCKWMD